MISPAQLSEIGMSRLVSPLRPRVLDPLLLAGRYSTEPFDLNAFEHLLRRWFAPFVDLTRFQYFYPSAGILEALTFDLLRFEEVQMLNGDFSYLKDICPNRVAQVESFEELKAAVPFYLSYPSAIDGSQDQRRVLQTMGIDAPVYLDLAYSCIAEPPELPLVPPDNVERLYFSFSKMLGLNDLRSGFVFSPKEDKVLELLKGKRFFSQTSLRVVAELIGKFHLGQFVQPVRRFQKLACTELGLEPSECVILGVSNHEVFDHWRRGPVNRICLSTYMYNRYPKLREDFHLCGS